MKRTHQTDERISENDRSGNKVKFPKPIRHTQYNTKTLKGTTNSLSIFLELFKPVKQSKDLIRAIELAYEYQGEVTFNYGNGNQTFFFKKTN